MKTGFRDEINQMAKALGKKAIFDPSRECVVFCSSDEIEVSKKRFEKLQKKAEKLKKKAKRIGEKQEVIRNVVDCDGSEECSTDILILYAMPDGTLHVRGITYSNKNMRPITF